MTAKRSKQAAQDGPSGGRPVDAGDANPTVARALRTAYEEAVREDVPAEFLDLLNKLS